jgi:hypothetical protein
MTDPSKLDKFMWDQYSYTIQKSSGEELDSEPQYPQKCKLRI